MELRSRKMHLGKLTTFFCSIRPKSLSFHFVVIIINQKDVQSNVAKIIFSPSKVSNSRTECAFFTKGKQLPIM